MAEILEIPDDLLDQLRTQFKSNNNHDTSNNDDVDVVDDGLNRTIVARKRSRSVINRSLFSEAETNSINKSNRSDRPFKLQQLEFDKVIHHIKLDEKYYLQQ